MWKLQDNAVKKFSKIQCGKLGKITFDKSFKYLLLSTQNMAAKFS